MTEETQVGTTAEAVVPKKKGGRPKGSGGRPQLSRAQIGQAKAWREIEGLSISQIAARLKVHPDTIDRLFKRLGGVQKGSRTSQAVAKAEEKLEQAVIGTTQEKALLIRQAREESRKSSELIRKLIVKRLVKIAQSGSDDFGIASNDIKTLKEAMSGIEISQRVSFTSLGIKDGKDENEDELPELSLKELTDEEVKEVQKKSMQELIDEAGVVDTGLEGDDDIIEETGDEDIVD